MIRAIRMLLSTAVLVSALSSAEWSGSIDLMNEWKSTQAMNSPTITKTVTQPVPAMPSTKISTKAPDNPDNNPSTQAQEEPSVPSDHEDEDELTYVLNKNTKKFHYPYCRSVKQMKASNKKILTASREYILEMGYDPCQICNP